MNAEKIAELRALRKAATSGEWVWTLTAQKTRADVLLRFAETYDRGDEGPLHGAGVAAAVVIKGAEWLDTAITGNGPTSEANAKFIVAASAEFDSLLDEIERQAAEIERLKLQLWYADQVTDAIVGRFRNLADNRGDADRGLAYVVTEEAKRFTDYKDARGQYDA